MQILEQKLPFRILVILENCKMSKETSLHCSDHKPVHEVVLDLARLLALSTLFETIT